MLENHLEENGNDLPPIEDITTIPEEASEELREEEEAAALEAALRTPDGGTISTEIEKPSTLTQEWVALMTRIRFYRFPQHSHLKQVLISLIIYTRRWHTRFAVLEKVDVSIEKRTNTE